MSSASVASSVCIACTWVWVGMVGAISFMEAPLKFRAPNVSLAQGLAIGRIVFRALNTVEVGLASAIGIATFSTNSHAISGGAMVAEGVAVAALAAQLLLVRPRLNRRADAVLAGKVPESAPRSHAHHAYIALEVAKLGALITAGTLLFKH